MRYAILSDVHGNLQALSSALSRIDRMSVDRRICLGDIVGYGGNPNECVEEIRRSADLCLAGNHDHAAVGRTDCGSFNPHARWAIGWTGTVLTGPNRLYLSELPLVSNEGSMFFVHASPVEPPQWHYVITAGGAEEAFAGFEEDLCFIGHSHRPMVAARESGSRCELSFRPEVRLRPAVRYIINVGSVGQPRDGDPRAAFLVLDTGDRVARLERVPYDVEAAGAAILQAGLPVPLAERLRDGR